MIVFFNFKPSDNKLLTPLSYSIPVKAKCDRFFQNVDLKLKASYNLYESYKSQEIDK